MAVMPAAKARQFMMVLVLATLGPVVFFMAAHVRTGTGQFVLSKHSRVLGAGAAASPSAAEQSLAMPEAGWRVDMNENAVLGFSAAVAHSDGSSSSKACALACKADGACNVWTWAPPSAKTAGCWFRSDGIYAPVGTQGWISGMDISRDSWDSDTRKFRQYLFHNQFPAKCSGPKMRRWSGWHFGIGSNMHVLRNNFLLALAKGETFLSNYNREVYASRVRCKGQDLNCFFEERCASTHPPTHHPP